MIHIALLDDQQEYAHKFQQFFAETPQQIKCVFTAENTQELCQKLSNKYYGNVQFLFLDIMLAHESGLDIVATINRRYPQIEIIMHTVVEDSESIIKAMASGAQGYLLKSHSYAEIADYIHTSLKGGAAMSPIVARKMIQYFRPNDFKRGKLGGRTVQVLHFLAEGWSYKMIADKMGITVDGVRFHIKEIYRTLNVQSKPQAVRRYLDGDY